MLLSSLLLLLLTLSFFVFIFIIIIKRFPGNFDVLAPVSFKTLTKKSSLLAKYIFQIKDIDGTSGT